MPIQGSVPYVIPSETFPIWWMSSLVIQAPDPNGKVKAIVQLVPAKVNQDGTKVLSKVGSVNLFMDDVFEAAKTDSELSSVINSLLAKVQSLALAKGIIK